VENQKLLSAELLEEVSGGSLGGVLRVVGDTVVIVFGLAVVALAAEGLILNFVENQTVKGKAEAVARALHLNELPTVVRKLFPITCSYD
jgi:hypothetical protein